MVLLLGSPRSGTTWLAKILDTYPRVLYLHEPLTKLRYPPLDAAFGRLKHQEAIGSAERAELLAHLAQLHPACIRAPVFAKTFLRLPAGAVQTALLLSQPNRWSRDLFRRWFSPSPREPFDLLIKEVDWQLHCASLVDSLNPDRVIFIVRHPCAVVCSRLNGLRMGVMPGHDRAEWVASHRERIAAVGFEAQQVIKMSAWGFYALDWLLQNLEYQRLARSRPGCQTVVFESLCQDPDRVAGDLFESLGWEKPAATTRFIRASGRPSWKRAMMGRISNWRTYYDLHRDPGEAAGKWQSLLSREQVEEILEVARPFPGMRWWPEVIA